MEVDYEYMANALASLSGVPVRIYREGRLAGLYHHSDFTPDPAVLEEKRIFENPGNVSYHMTDTFLFYGLFRMKHAPVSLVMGPVAQVNPDRAAACEILRSMGEAPGRARELMEYMQSIPTYPLRNFLRILCTLNYFINDEKLNVKDLLTDEALPLIPGGETSSPAKQQYGFVHNTYELEQLLLSIVEHGRVEDLSAMIASPPVGRAGIMANDAIRQQKNLFICTAALVTRAAIRGGLDRESAFSLSDVYIQKVELLKTCQEVMGLQVAMVRDFTRRVADATCGEKNDPRIRRARDYIFQHIDRRVTTEELSHELGLNRTYLCSLFQERTGMSVGSYVTALKLNEAKRLLEISDKSLEQIAAYLGFSSQSHFQNAFRKHTGITPGAYRSQRKMH